MLKFSQRDIFQASGISTNSGTINSVASKMKKALKWLKTRLEFTALPRWRKYSLSFHHHEPNRVSPGASVLWDLHVHSTSRGPNTYTRVCPPPKKTDRSRHWCNALQQYTNRRPIYSVQSRALHSGRVKERYMMTSKLRACVSSRYQ